MQYLQLQLLMVDMKLINKCTLKTILRENVIQRDFFNWTSPENVSRLAPPKFAWSGPP